MHRRNRRVFYYLKNYIPDIKIFVPRKWKGSLGEKMYLHKKMKENGVEIVPLKWEYFKNIQLQVFLPFFSTYLNVKKPDIIIFLEESFSLSTFEFSLFFSDIPFVFFSAQNIYKNYPFPFNFFQRFVFKKAKGSLCVSGQAQEVLKKWGFNKKNFIFYLGLEPQKFKNCVPHPSLIYLDKPIFAFIGRLSKIKGVYIFLEAFDKFFDKYKKGTILFVGEGEEKNNLFQECKKRNINFYFMSYVPHEQIYSIYKSVDFVVLPSLTSKTWKEQFGRVLVEGMAAGVSVIGSDSGAIPEIIGDAGLIFKEGDPQDLFKKMERLFLDEKLRNTLIKKGYKRVEENFTYEVIAKKLYEFLKEILRDEN